MKKIKTIFSRIKKWFSRRITSRNFWVTILSIGNGVFQFIDLLKETSHEPFSTKFIAIYEAANSGQLEGLILGIVGIINFIWHIFKP